jgi:hypothetical protein
MIYFLKITKQKRIPFLVAIKMKWIVYDMTSMRIEQLLREFDMCCWPPPQPLIEEAKGCVLEGGNFHLIHSLKEYIRVSEYVINLSNTVHEALSIIEEAEKNMNEGTYFSLIDSMHKLSLVGERKSDLYKEMFITAEMAMSRMNYIL